MGLMQALQQRQIPPLPAPQPPPYAWPPPQVAPTAAPPAADGMSLLRMILGNPQFQQTLWGQHPAAGPSPVVPLQLPIAGLPNRRRSVPIPLGAVMNAISMLAGQSMTELNAGTREEDPEVPSYLVSEDGEFVVDPASPDDRAALVTHLFRINDAAQQLDTAGPQDDFLFDDNGFGFSSELDESEAWAENLGFGM